MKSIAQDCAQTKGILFLILGTFAAKEYYAYKFERNTFIIISHRDVREVLRVTGSLLRHC